MFLRVLTRFRAAAAIGSIIVLWTASSVSALPDQRRAFELQARNVLDPAGAQLVGRSILPAATYVKDTEPSGHWTKGNDAIPAPYRGQPGSEAQAPR